MLLRTIAFASANGGVDRVRNIVVELIGISGGDKLGQSRRTRYRLLLNVAVRTRTFELLDVRTEHVRPLVKIDARCASVPSD